MKMILKIAVGSALAAASMAAGAAQLVTPSTGNTNLLFYVADLTTHQTYTVDLIDTSVLGGSVSVNGVATTTTGVFTTAQALSSTTQGVVNTVFGNTGFSYNLSGDTALTTFISGLASTDSIGWGIYATGYNHLTPDVQGNSLVITTGNDASIVSISDTALTSSVTAAQQKDYNTLNTNFGTSKDTFTAAPGTANGVFGTSSSTTALTFYGNGMSTTQTIGGPAVTLYGLTGNGTGSGQAIAYNLGAISFINDVLTFTGNQMSAVPLPAAAWLLGSGLLGLLGIGRRRIAVQAA